MMVWNEVTPCQDDWERQINVMAYYETINVGSIVYCGSEIGWQSVIDGSMDLLDTETEEQAKSEMIDRLDNHFEGQINYFTELKENLEDLNC